jgi:hypothetical protein
MGKFQIDPKVQMAIAFLVGAITFLASAALPDSVPPATVKAIHDWAGLFNQFYITILTPLMLAYTNSNPGPLAPPDAPSVVVAKTKADAIVTKDAKDVTP